MENIKNTVEAIIFASGSPILKSDIVEKVPELTTQKLNSIIKELQQQYSGESGVLLAEFNGKVQFMSNPRYGETVADVLTPLREKELTNTLLEVLSSIAYSVLSAYDGYQTGFQKCADCIFRALAGSHIFKFQTRYRLFVGN